MRQADDECQIGTLANAVPVNCGSRARLSVVGQPYRAATTTLLNQLHCNSRLQPQIRTRKESYRCVCVEMQSHSRMTGHNSLQKLLNSGLHTALPITTRPQVPLIKLMQ